MDFTRFLLTVFFEQYVERYLVCLSFSKKKSQVPYDNSKVWSITENCLSDEENLWGSNFNVFI